MNQVQLNVEELKNFIKHMVKNNQHIQTEGKVPVAINIEGDAKAAATQKLQSKLNQGLSQYNLTVSQDTDVPYSNVIGFLIPIADFKLFIKNAISGGSSVETPPPPAV